jgi:site-specific DNA-cytosine methylase
VNIKTNTITASMGTWWWNVPAIVEVVDGEVRVKQATKQWYIVAEEWDGISLAFPSSTTRRWRVTKWKSNTITTEWDSCVYEPKMEYNPQMVRIRKLTPIECERLQTLEDNYTEWVSDTQRYKMLWNWWTVDVIAHIFSFIKE